MFEVFEVWLLLSSSLTSSPSSSPKEEKLCLRWRLCKQERGGRRHVPPGEYVYINDRVACHNYLIAM